MDIIIPSIFLPILGVKMEKNVSLRGHKKHFPEVGFLKNFFNVILDSLKPLKNLLLQFLGFSHL